MSRNQSRRVIISAGLLAFLTGVTLVALGLFGVFNGSGSGAFSVLPPTSETPIQITPSPSLPPTPETTPAPTPRPTPPLPESAYRMTIDSIGVISAIQTFGLDANNIPVVPNYQNSRDPKNIIAWYSFSARPGTGSNAVFAGHVTWDGPGVFWDLYQVKPGDAIKLAGEGSPELVYRVTDNFLVDANDPNATQVMAGGSEDVITLITCGGDFVRDPNNHIAGGDYTNRRVVRAVLESITPVAGNMESGRG